MDGSILRDDKTLVRRRILMIGLLALAIVGQALWNGHQIGSMRARVDNNERRVELLERVGSPAVGEVRVLQMRALQSVDQRRIDALEAVVAALRERLDAASRTAEALHDQIDRRQDTEARLQADAAGVVARQQTILSLLQEVRTQMAEHLLQAGGPSRRH
jgi:hypothetical protein